MQMKSVRRLCAAMMIFSVAVRLVTATENMAAAGMLQPKEEEQDAVYTVHIMKNEQPQADKTLPEEADRLLFSAEEARRITIGGRCNYAVDKQALLLRPSGLDFTKEGPKVLVVHTHSSEAYTPEAGMEYVSSDPLRTEDTERSVIRVGRQICQILRQNGIETLHDETINDYPTYAGSYDRMRTIISGYIQQYPSIQMVLDIHRDAAMNPDGTQVAFRTELDGEGAAQIMFVVGTDAGGLEHPNWEENLANVLKLQAVLNRRAPTLCRDVDLRTERFNADLCPGAMLVEFGSTGNTLSEALCAARHFAQGLAETISCGF